MDISTEFIRASRRYLANEYLPKIERCLELLDEDEVWWRPNQHSNSIGNLVLHLAGNVRQYVVSGAGGEPDIRRRDEEFAAAQGGKPAAGSTSAVASTSAKGMKSAERSKLEDSDTPTEGRTPAAGRTLAELSEHLRATMADVARVLDDLDPAVLQEIRTVQGREMTVFKAIYHAVEHFSMHTGQIIQITKQLKDTDLNFYSFKDGSVQTWW